MEFDLQEYLTGGVIQLVKEIARATLNHPKASLFMTQFIRANQKSNQKRMEAEKRGQHVPPFLIASITTQCNLHCKGCYARANHNCSDEKVREELLTSEEWNQIFEEAEEMGVSFILLAGGEPFLRQDVLKIAGQHKKILFPIFTNGTMLTEDGMELLDRNPNLLPVLSIEGNESTTDGRRGAGTYTRLLKAMADLKQKSRIFGNSITVQKQNMIEVMGDTFVQELIANGCKAIIYVEYVPVDHNTEQLAPGPEERAYMGLRLTELRKQYPEMILLSFPGDEHVMGGCLAAGRGFFHINAFGGAEPCPFSAYSDRSLKKISLKQALQSPLFVRLRESGALEEDHVGGCTLFQQEETVRLFSRGETE